MWLTLKFLKERLPQPPLCILPLILRTKKKGKMSPPPPSLPTPVQTNVSLTLFQVVKAVTRKVIMFDRWYQHRTSVSFRTIFDERIVEELADLESQMLDWAETDDLKSALGRRSYIDFHLRETLLRLNVLQKKQNFDLLNCTAPDDVVVITKLEATIQIVYSKVQYKRMEFEMPPQPISKTIDIYASLALSMLNEMSMDEDMMENMIMKRRDQAKSLWL